MRQTLSHFRHLRHFNHLALLIVAVVASAALSAKEVQVGDRAPALNEQNIYVKGGTPQALDAGKISIVELWATWCGPCRVSIPHLSKVQAQHGDQLQIIGLTRENVELVAPFVEERGDTMNYIVGAGAEVDFATYYEGAPGIPIAYIVDGKGIVQWKGNPMEGMDEALEYIIKGTYQQIREATQALEKTFESNHLPTITVANEKLLAIDPLNRIGINIGMRLAQLKKDRAEFRGLFTRIPANELRPAQAAQLIDSLFEFEDSSWLEPKQLKALGQQAVHGDDEKHNDRYLAAARVAHFIGDIAGAIALAEKAQEQQVEGAAGFVELYQAIANL